MAAPRPSPALLLGALLLAPPVAAQEPAPPPADELPPLVKDPAVLDFVQAPFPDEAREAGVDGKVLLLIEIDASGAVTRVEVLEPAGYGFDEAALEAAKTLRFSPAEDATGPVPVAIEFAYHFVQDAASAPEAVPEGPPADLPVNLTGALVELGTRAPLADVAVALVRADGGVLEATTGADGRFGFAGVPAGVHRLRVVSPVHEPLEAEVTVGADELVDVTLRPRSLGGRDNEVLGLYRKKTPDITRRSLTIDEIRRVPGTFGDPVRVIQSLPGAARSPLGTGLLVIRGANPEDSGVYVDGIRIPLIYHLGGYTSVLNADLIESVDYLPGSYGVQYGRTMGGAIDVKTRSTFPERSRIVWDTDALDTGVFFEGRVGKEKDVGIAIAGRRSYVDAIIPLVSPNPEITVKPRWYDYQLKLQGLGDGPGEWSAFLFGFEDRLIASTPPGFAQGSDPDTQGDLGTIYLTHRAYFRYSRPLNDQWTLTLLPSLGLDRVNFSVGSSFRVDQYQLLAEARAELLWAPSAHLSTTFGLDFIGGAWWFEAGLPLSPDVLDDYDPLGEREPFTTSGTGTGWGPDLYVDLLIQPLQDVERLLIRPGVRMNAVALDDFSRDTDPKMLRILAFDPRLSARFAATRATAVKGAVGLYHQPPQPFEVWRPEGEVDLRFERALSTEVGLEQLFGESVEADLSLFWKRLDQQIVTAYDYTGLDSQFFSNEGIGQIRGVEFIVRKRAVGPFFGWISYTLSQSLRNDYPTRPEVLDASGDAVVGADAWYPFSFDQTHILVAVGGLDLPKDWGVSTRVQYVTGNPYTPYGGGVNDLDLQVYVPYPEGGTNSARMPAFLAVDLRVDKRFVFENWQLETYLDLLNAIRGENPEFVLDNYDYTEERYFRGLPFIPSPGFRAEFFF
jgi:TonB family protein